MINKWDEELARHLRPVAAPEDLWFRIQEPQIGRGVALTRWPIWAFAAALAATIALFCFSLRSDTNSYMAKFDAGELTRGIDNVQFRSADPARIRAWVMENAGIDIPLPAKAEGAVKLIGASVFHSGSPMVCVTYRAGNQEARLLVTRASAAAPHHASIEQSSYRGASFSSWVMDGRSYLLAVSTTGNAACRLCHVKG